MAMCLQPFLCVAEHLALERELPAAVSTALSRQGFPPLALAKKIKSKLHEFWQLEFSAAVPPSECAIINSGTPGSCAVAASMKGRRSAPAPAL